MSGARCNVRTHMPVGGGRRTGWLARSAVVLHFSYGVSCVLADAALGHMWYPRLGYLLSKKGSPVIQHSCTWRLRT